MNRHVKDVMDGAIGGAVATVGMSVVMAAAQKVGVLGEPPPRQLTDAALDATGAPDISEGSKDAIAAGAHLGFGVLAGALFGFLHRKLPLPIPPVPHGVVYGLAVWAVSYKGWIPAAGILPPPEHDLPGRRRSMILAHCVYGGILGTTVGRLEG